MQAPLRYWLHGLAERLGYTVAELSDRMSVDELRDWIAYDRVVARSHPAAPR